MRTNPDEVKIGDDNFDSNSFLSTRNDYMTQKVKHFPRLQFHSKWKTHNLTSFHFFIFCTDESGTFAPCIFYTYSLSICFRELFIKRAEFFFKIKATNETNCFPALIIIHEVYTLWTLQKIPFFTFPLSYGRSNYSNRELIFNMLIHNWDEWYKWKLSESIRFKFIWNLIYRQFLLLLNNKIWVVKSLKHYSSSAH